jgi:ribulose-phosphate 3-epimerase
MMVLRPEQWINDMADAGVDQYTFHVEPVNDIADVCRKVREAGMKVGLALKPDTPVEFVEQYIELADLVLIMTVEPGFGGQKFMEKMMPKVKKLRDNYPTLNIEVDGGVTLSTIDCCAKAGANWIVSGTGIIKAQDQRTVMKQLKDSVTQAISDNSK